MSRFKISPKRPPRAAARPRPIAIMLAAVWMAGFLPSPPAARAHQWLLSEAHVVLGENGSWQVDFHYDYDAMLMDVPPGQPTPAMYLDYLDHSTPEEREKRLEGIKLWLVKTIRFIFDGQSVPPDAITFPDFGQRETPLPGQPPDDRPEGPWPGHRARLTGAIPPGAASFTFRASKAYGPVALQLVQRTGAVDSEPSRQLLAQGGESELFLLNVAPPPPRRLHVAWQYLVLGFEHIIPKGLDHILFVVGLFLLGVRMRPLLFQVTAFTLAHSVTLALSIYGVLSLPAAAVEPIIAASIVWIAVENIMTSEMKPWRPAVVFCFGLLHGLGFAGVLTELGLPRGEFVTALVAFNVGVEFGQLAVILLAFLAVGWFRDRSWYRARVVIPVSAGIALVAAYWTVQRAMGWG